MLDKKSSHHAVGSATEQNVMQKHAIALGYFFLSVFCIFTSSQGYLPLRRPLLIVSLLSALTGIGFLMSAWAAQFLTAWKWWLQLVRLGQQAPINDHHQSTEGLSGN